MQSRGFAQILLQQQKIASPDFASTTKNCQQTM
jgi:hypothetical protein